ncbi:MAG: NAD-dependent epimerase/dehydratase family protein [Clostridia bacterium]|nr:NAD-dependent epimerase/dehydratase family protein [Clostridia bacterium]
MFDHPLYLEDLRDAAEGFACLSGKTVLITGATGLIGTVMTGALAGVGAKVIAVCRNEARAKARFGKYENVTVLAADMTSDATVLPEADYYVHAAANAHPAAFSKDPVGTMLGNINGVRAVIESLRRYGHGRMLFVSSGEVYGQNPDIRSFSEGDYGRIDPMNPRSCYPESKRAAETMVASAVRQYGIDGVTARLCYIYGPTITEDNSRADAQFLRNAVAGVPILMKSSGEQVRSYCYVSDAVRGLLTVLVKGKAGEAYNVADKGSVMSILEYAQTLAWVSDTTLDFDLPPDWEKQGYSPVTRAVQNPEKLMALGWTPKRNGLTGLDRTYRILKEN